MHDNKPLVNFEYSISNDEENIAFKEFQKKYIYKKIIIKTILFAIVTVFLIQQVISKPDYTIGYALIGVSLAIIYFMWYNPVKIRKSLVKALKELENDIYEFELYDEYFSIKTIYCENNDIKDLSELEEMGKNQKEIPPRLVYFDKEPVDVVEIEEMFVLFIKKETIYILPKRVISTTQQEEIRRVFKEKIEEDYITK